LCNYEIIVFLNFFILDNEHTKNNCLLLSIGRLSLTYKKNDDGSLDYSVISFTAQLYFSSFIVVCIVALKSGNPERALYKNIK